MAKRSTKKEALPGEKPRAFLIGTMTLTSLVDAIAQESADKAIENAKEPRLAPEERGHEPRMN